MNTLPGAGDDQEQLIFSNRKCPALAGAGEADAGSGSMNGSKRVVNNGRISDTAGSGQTWAIPGQPEAAGVQDTTQACNSPEEVAGGRERSSGLVHPIRISLQRRAVGRPTGQQGLTRVHPPNYPRAYAGAQAWQRVTHSGACAACQK